MNAATTAPAPVLTMMRNDPAFETLVDRVERERLLDTAPGPGRRHLAEVYASGVVGFAFGVHLSRCES